MELIPSFQVDHTKLTPGIYVSRIDRIDQSFITTFDVRMKIPNREPVIHPNAMHTIEHIVATYLRNDKVCKDKIIYWGPMGCLTGCYLIMKGRPQPREIAPLLIEAFKFCRDYNEEIPGVSPVCCGNYLLHDLNMAKYEAGLYVKILEERPCFEYPVADKPEKEGVLFFDS